jgi:hypothetical protein
MSVAAASHRWRFFRAGGADQVSIESGADLVHLGALDPKLWVALACPVHGLEADERTLQLIDVDGDGRIRAPELIAAAQWATQMVVDPDVLLRGGDLPVAAINGATEEGARIAAAARAVLRNLGKADAPTVSVADTMQTAAVFAATPFNGDGIIPVEQIGDATLRTVAEEIVAHEGAVTDFSGLVGIDAATVAAFFEAAEAFTAWWAHGEANGATLLPLGEGTPAAAAALSALRVKIDDYFARTRLAAYDARSLSALNRAESEYLAIAAADMKITADEVSGFPLARVEIGRALPLTVGVNPAWESAMATFRTTCVAPLLGEDVGVLTEAAWRDLQATLAPYMAWQADKPGARVEALGIARLREILASEARTGLEALIAQDVAREPEMTAIAQVERLARYQRDLVSLLNNFLAFRDFYARKTPAIFQAGTLVLDGRSCDLCVRVTDAGKHAALAALSKTYLAYCDCTRPGGEHMTIAAAFTDGDGDNLMVGRNGVFWDRSGRDWDATITKVIENPISVRQAFWAPYKKLVRLIEEQVAKRAAAGEEAADAKLNTAPSTAATADQQAAAAAPKKIDVGTVAALGVAFGALGTAFAALAGYLTGILSLPFWQVCLAFAGLLLMISTPSMLIAWLKLRQRNLGPLLDANGWAVNARVQMNVPFGARLTSVATLPANAQSSLAVPYPEAPSLLPRLIFTLIGVGFVLSLLAHFGALRAFGIEPIPVAPAPVEAPALEQPNAAGD